MTAIDSAQPIRLIFGGSFDPPHRAHVSLPAQAAQALGADQVVYVPAGQPPHKQNQSLTAPAHRLAMLQRALEDQPNTLICTDELEQEGPSYTVHTLEKLRDRWPNDKLRLLIGADMASIFYQWHRPQQILDLAEPLVMLRPPQTAMDVIASLPEHLSDAEKSLWTQRMVPVDTLDLSSTQLRGLLAEGQLDHPQVLQALDPKVRQYIDQHGLYR